MTNDHLHDAGHSETTGDGTSAWPAVQGLRRLPEGSLLGGVATGVAAHFALDVSLVRLGFVLAALVGGLGIPLYVAAWLLVPEQGEERSVLTELLSSPRGL